MASRYFQMDHSIVCWLQSGLLTSLPYLAMWLVGCISAFIADFAVNKKIMSLSDVRKVGNTIGLCPHT